MRRIASFLMSLVLLAGVSLPAAAQDIVIPPGPVDRAKIGPGPADLVNIDQQPLLEFDHDLQVWGMVKDTYRVAGMRYVEIEDTWDRTYVLPLTAVHTGTFPMAGDYVRAAVRPGHLEVLGINTGYLTLEDNENRLLQWPLSDLPAEATEDKMLAVRLSDGTIAAMPLADALWLLGQGNYGLTVDDIATR